MLIFSVDNLTDILPCRTCRLDVLSNESLCNKSDDLTGKVIRICSEVFIMQIAIVRLLFDREKDSIQLLLVLRPSIRIGGCRFLFLFLLQTFVDTSKFQVIMILKRKDGMCISRCPSP